MLRYNQVTAAYCNASAVAGAFFYVGRSNTMNARTPQEIGKIMASLREEKGWSQDELALIASVNLKDIKKIEGGSDKSSSVAFLRVFHALEVKNPDKIIFK